MNLIRNSLLIVLLSFLNQSSFAAIDLVTVPKVESTQLTIYNSADITMVRQSRTGVRIKTERMKAFPDKIKRAGDDSQANRSKNKKR